MRRRRGQKPKDPERLGGKVHGVLTDLGYDTSTPGLVLARAWPEIVGEEVAAHSEPIDLRGDQLEVRADSSAWSQYLQIHRDEILGRIAERLPQDAPTRMRMRVG